MYIVSVIDTFSWIWIQARLKSADFYQWKNSKVKQTIATLNTQQNTRPLTHIRALTISHTYKTNRCKNTRKRYWTNIRERVKRELLRRNRRSHWRRSLHGFDKCAYGKSTMLTALLILSLPVIYELNLGLNTGDHIILTHTKHSIGVKALQAIVVNRPGSVWLL